MKRKISLLSAISILLLFSAPPLFIDAAEDKPLSEKEKIESLIKHLENLKDAKFIRNNSEYDSKSAARFLRGKWETQGKKIKTATDFIEVAGSVSSTSGKPYVIRFKDGREVKCGSYLKEELKKLEKSR
jgi:hypothetical protein